MSFFTSSTIHIICIFCIASKLTLQHIFEMGIENIFASNKMEYDFSDAKLYQYDFIWPVSIFI